MKTLLLNADYTPYDLIGWKRALSLLWQENQPVVCLCHHKKYKMDSKGRKHYVPSILILKEYQGHIRLATYSKSAIFARDKMTCQYCGKVCTHETVSLDHVIPRSKWLNGTGRVSSFENVVTCCKRCNKRKGDRIPGEAGMKLLKQPRRINRQQLLARKAILLGLDYPEWRPYLESYND